MISLGAAIVETENSIAGMEYKDLTAVELARKLTENISSLPMDPANKICPYCNHKNVSQPKSNDANFVHNANDSTVSSKDQYEKYHDERYSLTAPRSTVTFHPPSLGNTIQ